MTALGMIDRDLEILIPGQLQLSTAEGMHPQELATHKLEQAGANYWKVSQHAAVMVS